MRVTVAGKAGSGKTESGEEVLAPLAGMAASLSVAASAQSPCTKVCVLDTATGWCLGCGRTGAEIAAWPTMTAAARIALRQRLPVRLSRFAGRGP
jgi:uncharacterized protein